MVINIRTEEIEKLIFNNLNTKILDCLRKSILINEPLILDEPICKLELDKEITNNIKESKKIEEIFDFSGNFILKDSQFLHNPFSTVIKGCPKVFTSKTSIQDNSSLIRSFKNELHIIYKYHMINYFRNSIHNFSLNKTKHHLMNSPLEI